MALLLVGQCVSSLGDGMFPIALSVYLVSRGAGAGTIAAFLGARAIGSLLGILVAGTVIDRFRRTLVMWVSDAVRLLIVAAIVWSVVRRELAVTDVLMGGMGLTSSFFIPAFRSIIPRLVSAADIKQANSLNATLLQISSVLGPGAAGALIAVSSPLAVIWADVASFAVSILTLLLIRETSAPSDSPVKHQSVVAQAFGGFTAVRQIRWLWIFIVAGMLQMAFAVAPWFSYLPAISLKEYGTSTPYSLSLTFYAVGGVLGALLAGRVKPRMVGLAAVAGPVCFSGILFCLAFGSAAPVLIGVHFVAGAMLEFSGVFQITAIHQQVPDQVMGRVMSLTLLGGAALTPVSYALIAGLSGTFSTQTVLVGGGILAMGVFVGPLLLPDFQYLDNSRRNRREPEIGDEGVHSTTAAFLAGAGECE